jgi:nitrite reductase/ring-hydroxylating ferredoxin subunit
MTEAGTSTRRELLSQVLMWTGLAAAYGTLVLQGWLFLLPKRLRPRTRRLFIGTLERFATGEVAAVPDLTGVQILVRRTATGVDAFSSVCPHLGCRVHWVPDRREFFCPCHRGIFDADGVAVSGPPADSDQRLARVPVEVDAASGAVYLEVPERRGARRT